jgi:hypothetical protein
MGLKHLDRLIIGISDIGNCDPGLVDIVGRRFPDIELSLHPLSEVIEQVDVFLSRFDFFVV